MSRKHVRTTRRGALDQPSTVSPRPVRERSPLVLDPAAARVWPRKQPGSAAAADGDPRVDARLRRLLVEAGILGMEGQGELWSGAPAASALPQPAPRPDTAARARLDAPVLMEAALVDEDADQLVNLADDGLERGDVVIIGDQPTAVFPVGPYTAPIPDVRRADRAYDTRVCGIVSEVYEAGEVDPVRVGGIVTRGSFAECKVDADAAPIRAGDLLTTGTTPGFAQRVDDPARAVGAILGKALAPLARGKGVIPVLVMLA